MKVHLLRCGTMCPLGGRLPLALAPRAMTCNCLLVETASGLVLVDTGIGHGDLANPRRIGKMSRIMGLQQRFGDTAIEQVKRMGFSPSDVRHIIPTHLDFDHVGGIADFPDAQIHLLESEKQAALSPATFTQRERYKKYLWAHNPKWRTYDENAGESWFGFENVRAPDGLPPEFLLVPLPGHTPGHVGVAIAQSGKWILHTGDAYYDHREIADPRRAPRGLRLFERLVHNRLDQARRTKLKLRDLTKTHSHQIRAICGHDCADELPSWAE